MSPVPQTPQPMMASFFVGEDPASGKLIIIITYHLRYYGDFYL